MSHPEKNPPVDRFVEALLSLDQIHLDEVEASLKHVAPLERLEALIVPALEEIGRRWERGTVSLSQVYLSGRACEQLSQVLIPAPDHPSRVHPRIAIATLEDFHALGKRLVLSALRASGYEVKDYGRMTVEQLVLAVEKDGVEVLLVSVLMLPSALRVKPLCESLRLLKARPVVVAGGAPFRFDRDLAAEVGADFWGRTASDAIEIVGRICRERA